MIFVYNLTVMHHNTKAKSFYVQTYLAITLSLVICYNNIIINFINTALFLNKKTKMHDRKEETLFTE